MEAKGRRPRVIWLVKVDRISGIQGKEMRRPDGAVIYLLLLYLSRWFTMTTYTSTTLVDPNQSDVPLSICPKPPNSRPRPVLLLSPSNRSIPITVIQVQNRTFRRKASHRRLSPRLPRPKGNRRQRTGRRRRLGSCTNSSTPSPPRCLGRSFASNFPGKMSK
jgi:hypothetical protein